MTINPENMHYQRGNDWLEFPLWACHYIELGKQVASADDGDSKLVIGISVPTKSYAAALTAFGLIAAKASIPVTSSDPRTHFKKLQSLGPRAPVTLLRNNRRSTGVIAGFTTIAQEPHIGVQENRRSRKIEPPTYYIPRSHCLSIQPSANQQSSSARPLIIQTNEPFLRTLGIEDPLLFAGSTRLECAIVGVMNEIKAQIETTVLSYGTPTEKTSGSIQDLLRTRRFLRGGEPYRSEVFTSIGQQPPDITPDQTPLAVIFDGVAGYIKWREYFPKSHWIVIMDRTEPHLEEATDILNEDYITLRQADWEVKMKSIDGIEHIAYWMNRS